MNAPNMKCVTISLEITVLKLISTNELIIDCHSEFPLENLIIQIIILIIISSPRTLK